MHVSFPSIWFAGRHPNGAVRTEHPNLKGGGGVGMEGFLAKGRAVVAVRADVQMWHTDR